MKNFVLTFLIVLVFINPNYGQALVRPLLDTSDFKDFPTFRNSYYIISNNGKYICYDQATSIVRHVSSKIAVVRAINGSWETKIDLDGNATFTPDSKYLIFKTYTDKQLACLELGSGHIDTFASVKNDRIIDGGENKAIISFIDLSNNLIILDLNKKKNRPLKIAYTI